MFFFFKQKTAYEMRISDWSSDVCSSDLSDVAFSADADTTAAPIFDVTTTVNQKQFSQELQVNGSLGPLSLTAGTYYSDEDIDYTLTADILPGIVRNSVGEGQSVSVRVDRGGRRILNKKNSIS